MCFEANPSLVGCPGPILGAGKKRPSTAGIRKSPGFKEVALSGDLEPLGTTNHAGGRGVVAQFDSILLTRLPQGLIQIEAGYTGTGRRDLRLDVRVIEENPGAANLRRTREQIGVTGPQQFLQQVERFRRHKLPANLMPWKMPTLEEQHFRAQAGRGDRGSATRRATAEHDQIVSHRGFFFQAITPMRYR